MQSSSSPNYDHRTRRSRMKEQGNNRNHNRRSHPVRRADKKQLHFPYQEQCPPILDDARISSSKRLARLFDMSRIDKGQHSKLIQKHTKGGCKKHGTIGQCHLICALLCIAVGHLVNNNSVRHLPSVHDTYRRSRGRQCTAYRLSPAFISVALIVCLYCGVDWYCT